jgi:hypothetical protein
MPATVRTLRTEEMPAKVGSKQLQGGQGRQEKQVQKRQLKRKKQKVSWKILTQNEVWIT